MAEATEFCYKSTLRTVYGLPDSWIARLGDPDKSVPNPHYRSGPPSSLYLRARVEAFIEENQADYERMIVERRSRQARARGAAEQREQALTAWAGAVEIVSRPLPDQQTLHDQVEVFYAWRNYERGRESDFYLTPGAVVAHLRHSYTNYETLLQYVEGNPGCAEAYLVLKRRCTEVAEGLLQQYEAVSV